jgi:polysaccharide biosynthesis transport protein
LLREKQANLQLLLTKKSEGVIEKLAGEIQGLEDRYNTIVQSENQINQKLACQQYPVRLRICSAN